MASQAKQSWLEMLLAGYVGYKAPSTLQSLGVGRAIYDNVPMYKQVVDAMYTAVNEDSGGTSQNNPWASGGVVGFGKVAGTLDGTRRVLGAAKRGSFGRGDLIGASFDLGLILDGPAPFGESGGSSGGYW